MKLLIKLLTVIFALSVIILPMSSCDFGKDKVASIEFTVDRRTITANNRERIKLNAVAKDKDGNEIKDAKIEFYNGRNILAYPEFRTKEEGLHELYAKCGDVKSETITIIATNQDVFSIKLTTDKFNIKNDGVDRAELKPIAYNGAGDEVNATMSYYANNEMPLSSNIFKTKESKITLVYAKAGSVTSNYVAISSNDSTIKIELQADKTIINNDGKDEVSFTYKITDSNGSEIKNAKAELYNNGDKLEGNTFSSNKEGIYSIYAVYDGTVSNTIVVEARDPNPPTYVGPESDLPVIVIDTNGRTINEKERITAIMYVYDKEVNSPDDAPDLVTYVGIRYRGQSSLTFPKKQFSIDTRDEAGNNNNVSLLGLPKENDWVLNGSYADKSLLRNYLAYEIFSQATDYAPRTRFCEVYVNDSKDPNNPYNYLGIYSLIEKIKIDKDRVNIERLTSEDNSGYNITGGYIVAQDKVKENEPKIPARQDFTFVHPDYDQLTREQRDYITKYVLDYSNALFGDNYLDLETGYKNYLDIKSYATSLAITEFFKAADGMDLSTYFYKPRGEKLHSGPAWDFDLSMGNTDFRTCTEPEGWYCVSLDEYPRRIMTDPVFVELFRSTWKMLRQKVLSDENIDRAIDDGIKTIENAIERNFERWPGQYNGNFVWPNPSGDDYTYTYEEEIKRLRNFLHKRAKWIDENIDKPIDLTPVHYDWINEFTFERMNPAPEDNRGFWDGFWNSDDNNNNRNDRGNRDRNNRWENRRRNRE